MNDAQLEKAARWLCEQRGRNPNDQMAAWNPGDPERDRWKEAADEIKEHMLMRRAINVAIYGGQPLSIHPTPDDVTRVRSENARRFDRILEDVEANKVPTWALQAAARAWCEPPTRMIEMDSRLAIEFAKVLVAERLRCERVVLGNMSEFAHNPGRSMFHDICSKMLDEVKGKR